MTNTKLFIRFLFYLFLIIKFSHANAQDYVEVRGNQINYEIKGHGEPWVIFITGYGDPMSSFDSVFDKTADLTTVVRYSRAGLGKSSYDFKGKDIDVIIQELESFIRILNVPKPFILIGHSYGGLIGRSYSKRYSERVCGLLLDDPTFEDYFEKLSKHEKNAKTIETKDNENWLNTDTSKSARDEFESLWKVWHSPKKWKNWFEPLPPIPIVILTSMKITGESLWNSKALMNERYGAHSRWISNMPFSIHLGLTSAGHFIHQDEPDVFVNSIRMLINFIKQTNK